MGVMAGDGTERVDGGIEDLARRNTGSSSSIYGSSTCCSFISGSTCGVAALAMSAAARTGASAAAWNDLQWW